jgi:hypothetical protein
MAASALPLGNLLPDESEVFRGFSNRNFLDNSRTVIRDRAYLRRKKDNDGLSVGVTPQDAVRNLRENYGVSGLSVERIHNLGRGLEVRADIGMIGHALICGLPFVELNRELAEAIAQELVAISRVVYAEPYAPNPGI